MHFAFQPTHADWIRWAISAGILLVFVALAFLSRFIMKGIMFVFARRTKTTLDDRIIQALTVPVFVMLIIGGLWIALARLTEIAPHIDLVHKIFIILYIGVVAVTVVKVAHAILNWYGEEIAVRTESDIDDRLIPIFRRIIDVVIYAIALMVLLARLNINISPILAGLGIGGLAVALALQSTLSNFLSGTYVITDAVIRKGHYIHMDGGPEGWVEDIGWRTTKIRDWQGNLVILPNGKLADSVVTDYDKPDISVVFSVDCGVSYESDLNKVERVTIDVAKKVLSEVPGGVKNHEPVLRFNKFDDSNINFSIVLKGTDRAAQFLLKHEFIKALQSRYKQEEIDIQYPVRKLLFGNSIPGK
jgi:small-conductance mechanosensitive channel